MIYVPLTQSIIPSLTHANTHASSPGTQRALDVVVIKGILQSQTYIFAKELSHLVNSRVKKRWAISFCTALCFRRPRNTRITRKESSIFLSGVSHYVRFLLNHLFFNFAFFYKRRYRVCLSAPKALEVAKLLSNVATPFFRFYRPTNDDERLLLRYLA